MNDERNTENTELSPDAVAQLMAELHAANPGVAVSDGEAASEEGTIFIAEDHTDHITIQ